MSHQVALTFCAEVQSGQRPALDQLVEQMAADPANNSVLPFADLPQTHFARIVVLDAPVAGIAVDTLLLTLDCDASIDDRIQDLTTIVGSGIDRLFGTCVHYPAQPTMPTRAEFLHSHLAQSQVFYVHAVGRTLGQIRDEDRLRRAIEDFVDERSDALSSQSAHAVRESIRAFVAADPDLTWALTPPTPPKPAWRLSETANKVGIPALVLLGLPVLVPAAIVWLVALRWHEREDPFPEVEPDPSRLRALGDSEDFLTQNAFTSLAPIRPGRFWRLTSNLTLLLGNYMARHVFTTGSLSGLTTVHFARFMKFGPDKDLLFTSYYDGSLESYNNDFVDQVAWVLNTVFGQQAGYPRTRWMVKQGAHNERWFKNFIRGHQVSTQVWYSAYPTLAAVTIDQNAKLRAGLSGDLQGKELDAWLRLL